MSASALSKLELTRCSMTTDNCHKANQRDFDSASKTIEFQRAPNEFRVLLRLSRPSPVCLELCGVKKWLST
jgi:hypothetical protein